MPLAPSTERELVHSRNIEMRGYRRRDGLYDVEAHLVDTKTTSFLRGDDPQPTLAGMPLHDMWVRITVDEALRVTDVSAATDASPYGLCRGAAASLQAIVGEQVRPGWSMMVKSRLAGARSCTHLMELLIPLATVAFQTLSQLRATRAERVDASGRPRRIDSCYAYASNRSVVARRWPAFHIADGDER